MNKVNGSVSAFRTKQRNEGENVAKQMQMAIQQLGGIAPLWTGVFPERVAQKIANEYAIAAKQGSGVLLPLGEDGMLVLGADLVNSSTMACLAVPEPEEKVEDPRLAEMAKEIEVLLETNRNLLDRLEAAEKDRAFGQPHHGHGKHTEI